MKMSEYMEKETPQHNFYDTAIYNTMLEEAGDWNIVENFKLKCTSTLTMHFFLVEKDSKYMFLTLSYIGIGLSMPRCYETEKHKYDNAIKDVKASIESNKLLH